MPIFDGLRQQKQDMGIIYLLARFSPSAALCFACITTRSKESVRVFVKDDNRVDAPSSATAASGFGSDLRYRKGRHVLSYLAEFGNERIFASLLRTGYFGLDTKDSDGETPLSWAVKSDNGAIIQLLLNAGVDINAPYGHFGNVLQVAAAQGFEQRVSMLLKYGADVNARNGYYGSALQTAVAKGSEPVVRLLLNNDADVNAKGGSYGT